MKQLTVTEIQGTSGGSLLAAPFQPATSTAIIVTYDTPYFSGINTMNSSVREQHNMVKNDINYSLQ